MELKELVRFADRRELPEQLELLWIERTGRNPVRDAISLERDWTKARLIGLAYVACAVISFLATMEFQVYMGQFAAACCYLFSAVLVLVGCVCFVFGYARVPDGKGRTREKNAEAFALVLESFMEWSALWPGDMPKSRDGLSAVADHLLGSAAEKLQKHEATDHAAADYLKKHSDLHAAFTERHTTLVMMGLAVPDWSRYFKSGAKAA